MAVKYNDSVTEVAGSQGHGHGVPRNDNVNCCACNVSSYYVNCSTKKTYEYNQVR